MIQANNGLKITEKLFFIFYYAVSDKPVQCLCLFTFNWYTTQLTTNMYRMSLQVIVILIMQNKSMNPTTED